MNKAQKILAAIAAILTTIAASGPDLVLFGTVTLRQVASVLAALLGGIAVRTPGHLPVYPSTAGPGLGKLPIALLVAVGLGASSCAHAPGPVVAFGTCAEHQTDVLSILPTIATDLATADYAGALGVLVSRVGIDLVKCAVQVFIDSHQSDVAASKDPTVTLQVARGQDWLRGAK